MGSWKSKAESIWFSAKIGDEPYEKYPAPTKIPGAAIEFDVHKIGQVKKVSLDILNGLAVVEF